MAPWALGGGDTTELLPQRPDVDPEPACDSALEGGPREVLRSSQHEGRHCPEHRELVLDRRLRTKPVRVPLYSVVDDGLTERTRRGEDLLCAAAARTPDEDIGVTLPVARGGEPRHRGREVCLEEHPRRSRGRGGASLVAVEEEDELPATALDKQL